MNDDSVEMSKVESLQDIRENIASFDTGWIDQLEIMKKLNLFRNASYWVYDAELQAFANAKFAGFTGMTAERYLNAKGDDYEGVQFHGNVNAWIETVVKQSWLESPELATTLESYASRVAGPDSMRRVKQAKWRFIELPRVDNSIKRSAEVGSPGPQTSDAGTGEAALSASEGERRLVSYLTAVRNSNLSLQIKQRWLKNNPELRCCVCGFSFVKTYGREFIEAHHIHPIGSRGENQITKEDDIIPVCSNCHRMLHIRGEAMSIAELQTILEQNR